MIATLINAAAVIVGSLIGLVLGKKFTEEKQTLVMTSAGIVTLLIGIYMALKTTSFVELVLALILGGLLGSALKIEDSVEKLGEHLENRFMKKPVVPGVAQEHESGHMERAHASWNFPKGFLDASVLFCAGAMTILGAIEAGVNKNYTLLLTKSVLDGFLALVFASVYGPGVAFSALSILVYQGVLTWLGIFLQPILSDLILTGISGAGGCLVLMIGLNLLKLKKIKTADFLPALVLLPLLLALSKLAATVIQ